MFHSLSPVDSGTVFYAALTGVILYLAALVGGWVDNWAVYHRLPQAIAEHRLGQPLRAAAHDADRRHRVAQHVRLGHQHLPRA